jgi:sporulation protein YlmC with PRC-barrel domain
MTPQDAIGLLRQVRDMPILDEDGRRCGVCDDLEFDGAPGKALWVANLLVGPGAWRSRAPFWLLWPLQGLAGRRVTRVPWHAVREIGPHILLKGRGEDFGLRVVEDRVAARMPKVAAL